MSEKSTIVNGISVIKFTDCEYCNESCGGICDQTTLYGGSKQCALCADITNCFIKDLYVQTIKAATQLAPFQDEYFKGLDTKAIAELAKKSQRLTSENRELEQKNEELKAQVDEWKENCNNNFELVAIRTKLLTDIANKLGLNTAIIERKDVFDKIDKLQSKEQLSLGQSQVIITLRNNLNVNKQKNANLLQENEELKKQLDKYLNQEEEEIRQLNNDNKLDDILESIKKANEQMEKEIKYKQALDEIEYYINNQGINNKWNMRIQRFKMGILDIISKAKEQKWKI